MDTFEITHATFLLTSNKNIDVKQDTFKFEGWSEEPTSVVLSKVFKSNHTPVRPDDGHNLKWLWFVIIVVMIILLLSGLGYYFIAARSLNNGNLSFQEKTEIEEAISESEYSRL